MVIQYSRPADMQLVPTGNPYVKIWDIKNVMKDLNKRSKVPSKDRINMYKRLLVGELACDKSFINHYGELYALEVAQKCIHDESYVPPRERAKCVYLRDGDLSGQPEPSVIDEIRAKLRQFMDAPDIFLFINAPTNECGRQYEAEEEASQAMFMSYLRAYYNNLAVIKPGIQVHVALVGSPAELRQKLRNFFSALTPNAPYYITVVYGGHGVLHGQGHSALHMQPSENCSATDEMDVNDFLRYVLNLKHEYFPNNIAYLNMILSQCFAHGFDQGRLEQDFPHQDDFVYYFTRDPNPQDLLKDHKRVQRTYENVDANGSLFNDGLQNHGNLFNGLLAEVIDQHQSQENIDVNQHRSGLRKRMKRLFSCLGKKRGSDKYKNL